MSDLEQQGYVVPCYVAADGDPWLHFLHGNVPGHEIDFMYRPEVPQGALSRQHFSHLARLIKYIEPQHGAEHAFAIGNLSRDDTQHEHGHGGVALIFGLRIRGACDHAGRPDPPFSHAIATVDRALDVATLYATATAFHRHVLGEAASAEWYRSYVNAAGEPPESIAGVLARYVEGFADLPRPSPSTMSLAWTNGGGTQPGRIVFVHADDAPFELLAHAASRLAAVLYRSDVRWSAISSGREADLPHGLSIRFLPESAIGRADHGTLRALSEIPDDEEAIARELFGARPVGRSRSSAISWRERRLAQGGDFCASSDPDPEIQVTADAPRSSTRPLATVMDEATPDFPTAMLAHIQGLVDEASDIRTTVRAPEIEDPPTLPVAPEVAVAPFAMADETTLVPCGDEAPKASSPEPREEAVIPAPVPEPPAEPAPEAAAPVSPRPAPMVPIPVHLPLVSPPPVREPRRDPPPNAARPKQAAIMGACLVAGLAGALYFALARGAGQPAPTPIVAAPTAPAMASVMSLEQHVEPPPPLATFPTVTDSASPNEPRTPPVAEPAAAPAPAAKKPTRAASTPPSTKLCGVRTGRPCF